MYSRKGFKPGKKALMLLGNGISENVPSLMVTWVSWLMCIPGISENKAVAVA